LRLVGGLTVITIILHPIGCIIGVGGRDGWGLGVHSRRWSSFDIGGDFLAHLLFFIRVSKDDDITVAGWSKEPTIEVTKESLGELLILRGVGESIFLLIGRKIHHRDPLGGPVMLMH
jgi:hypothetical protein